MMRRRKRRKNKGGIKYMVRMYIRMSILGRWKIVFLGSRTKGVLWNRWY